MSTMRPMLYRAWCPGAGQPESDCILVMANDVEHVAEQWAAWADAYLGEGDGPGVANGAVHRVHIGVGRSAVVEMIVTGYTASVYGACRPEVMERMAEDDETPRKRKLFRLRERGDMPPLPRTRRLHGVAATLDGVAAIYTDEDLRALRVAAYRHGVIDRPTLEEMQAAAEHSDGGVWSSKND